MPSKSIVATIENLYPELPPSARKIANYIQQNPLAIISLSLADIAKVTQTSKATVSRFFRQLGYSSHQQIKQALLNSRVSGFPVASPEQNNSSQLELEIENLAKTLNETSEQHINEIVSLMAKSSRISIVGYRNSYPVALHFRQQLLQIRPSVRILPQPGQTLSEELVDLAEDELIILLGFRRRPQGFNKLIETLSEHTCLLLTDPTGQIYNKQVRHLLVCHLGQSKAFDSYAAPMSLISMLCNKTYQKLGSSAQMRTTKVSNLYKDLDELSGM